MNIKRKKTDSHFDYSHFAVTSVEDLLTINYGKNERQRDKKQKLGLVN